MSWGNAQYNAWLFNTYCYRLCVESEVPEVDNDEVEITASVYSDYSPLSVDRNLCSSDCIVDP